ncbi:MAG: hypothetical protein MJ176_03425 [Treponema sp.]|nr:hypothetical protein [Treponema sp.]
MSGMTTTNLQDNEIVKASDLQLGGDGGIDNISFVFKAMTNCVNNVILGGKLKANTSGSGLSAKMDPIIGYHQDSDKMFIDHKGQVYMDGETEPADYVSFMAAESQDRRDIVEVKADIITAVEQSRQFYDPDTESTSYSQVDVEKRQILRVKVKKGEAGSNVAPETDTGYVKIAEVFIPANVSQLSDENIFNVTADIDGMDNSGWTVEKTATVNPGRIQDNKSIFRKIHNSDGSLKDSVIKAAKIALTGEGCLKGEAIQKGGVAKTLITGVSINPSDSLSTNIEAIADFLTPNPQDITKTIFHRIFRLGYILSTTDETNPGTIYGGTWEAYGQGRVLIGAGKGTDVNNVEKTFTAGAEGGEYSHSLSETELASHTHTFVGDETGSGDSSKNTTGNENANHSHNITVDKKTLIGKVNNNKVCLYHNIGSTSLTGIISGTLAGQSAGMTSYGSTTIENFTIDASHDHTASAGNQSASHGHDMSHTHTFVPLGHNENTGGGNAHNNMQPYVAVYMWRRTA